MALKCIIIATEIALSPNMAGCICYQTCLLKVAEVSV